MSRGLEYAKRILELHKKSNEGVADVGFPAVMLQEMVDEIENLKVSLDIAITKLELVTKDL